MNIGDTIQLKNQEVEIVSCNECDRQMVNIDADQLEPGDLTILKKADVSISNPNTEDEICIHCENRTIGHKIADWFSSDDSNDDDSSFFHPSPLTSSGSIFGGHSSFGGFGGFGGGSFSGGGASASF